MKRFFPLYAFCFFTLLVGCQNPLGNSGVLSDGGSARAVVNDFIEFNYDFKGDSTIDLPGRLFIPFTYDVNKVGGYRLILFFHGAGETGSDNQVQVQRNISHLASWAKAHDAFLYAPQLPKSKTAAWSASYVDNAVRQVANICRLYNIATDQIAVTGLSLGGGGVYLSMIRYDGAFAAGVSVSGVDPAGSPSLAPLVGQATWSFHASDDGTVNVSKFYTRMNLLRSLAGLSEDIFPPTYTDGVYQYPPASDVNQKFRYTNYETGGHAIWDRVYSLDALYAWIQTQSRPAAQNSLQEGERFLVDFGSLAAVTGTSETWNSTSANYQKTIGCALPFGKTSSGRGTGISVDVDQSFEKVFTTTTSGPYPQGVGSDGWQTFAGAAGQVGLRGLIVGAVYKLTIFGSTSLNHRVTLYSVSSAVPPQSLNATNNETQTVVFPEVIADAKGAIHLTVWGDSSSASPVGVINTLELELVHR